MPPTNKSRCGQQSSAIGGFRGGSVASTRPFLIVRISLSFRKHDLLETPVMKKMFAMRTTYPGARDLSFSCGNHLGLIFFTWEILIHHCLGGVSLTNPPIIISGYLVPCTSDLSTAARISFSSSSVKLSNTRFAATFSSR